MNMPRLIADHLSLWRDVVRFPRQVLLNRAHSFAAMAGIGVACAVDFLIDHVGTEVVAYVAVFAFGPSSLVSFAGSIAHTLWSRELIWADLECEWCGDDPDDDGGDGEPEPGEPDDPNGLIRDINEYLRNQHALTCTH
ncbi:hypothetical protein [Streptomyces niveus]